MLSSSLLICGSQTYAAAATSGGLFVGVLVGRGVGLLLLLAAHRRRGEVFTSLLVIVVDMVEW